MKQNISDELDYLREEYGATFGEDMLLLMAALNLHNFSIQRADEAYEVANSSTDLWPELSHPSVCLRAATVGKLELRLSELLPGSDDYAHCVKELIQANLKEQARIMLLLQKFYSRHAASSFSVRLIVETVELGESVLRPQGASVRLIGEASEQTQWLKEARAEIGAFAHFLSDQL